MIYFNMFGINSLIEPNVTFWDRNSKIEIGNYLSSSKIEQHNIN